MGMLDVQQLVTVKRVFHTAKRYKLEIPRISMLEPV